MNQPETMLNVLAPLVAEWRLGHLAARVESCRRLMQSRGSLEVAVLGRFKAGKSSFLNDLIGRAVLPVGVIPLTAVITRLRAGEQDRAEVQFLDGTRREIPVTDLALYVTEKENPENRRQVAQVEVVLPELKPLAPLTFVDTPGLGSALEHNTEVAWNWLPQAAAALVAISSDAPVSERDLNLLAELRRQTPRVALLLTKADLLTETQRTEVRSFVTSQLRRRGLTDLAVFFYSVRPELAALKSLLRTELLEPLRQHATEAGREILLHKLEELRMQLLQHLQVALAAAAQTESAREALRQRLAEERSRFDLLRAELSLLPHDAAARALDDYLLKLQPTQAALQARVTSELHQRMLEWRLPLPRILETWRAWLHDWLRHELSEISQDQADLFLEPLERTRTHLHRTLQAFHDRLSGHVRSALGVSLAPREFTLQLAPPEAPPVDVAWATEVMFSTLAWLIPTRLFRRPIEHVLARKARYEVAKNISRLAAAWRDRIQAALTRLSREAEAAARAELNDLERLLAQTPSDLPRLKEQMRRLEAFTGCCQEPAVCPQETASR